MDLGILAQRNAQALNRMIAAVETLAERKGLAVPTLKHGHIHDPQAAALYQREAIADFLEALVIESNPVDALTQRFQTAGQMLRGESTAAELLPLIPDLDLETLNELEAVEQAGKGRAGVLQAIAKRRDVLTAETVAA
jgi:hypothetical protein